MSSNSSISPSRGSSLHLVEHVRESRLELECLLDLVRAHKGVFAVFQKARTLMFTDELDECRGISLPVRRKAFEVFEDRLESGCPEQGHGVLGVLVKVRVKNA